MSYRTGRGFTLLEVLLVVLLMGLMAAAVTYSLGGGSQQQQLTQEAQRFVAVTETLSDEAVLSGQFVGIVVEKNAYHFVVLKDDKWQPLVRDNLFSERRLPLGISTDLQLEGLPLEQEEDQDSWFDEPFIDADKEDKKKFPEPQIMLLPSGEMTAFVLTLVAAGSSAHQQLVSGDNLGHLVLGRFDEQP